MKKKTNVYSVILIIFLIFQAILILLTFAYAFGGSYDHNKASNLWSVLWGKGLGLFLLLSDFFSFLLGIIGLITKKDNKTQGILSAVLLVTILPSIISLVFAVGSHF